MGMTFLSKQEALNFSLGMVFLTGIGFGVTARMFIRGSHWFEYLMAVIMGVGCVLCWAVAYWVFQECHVKGDLKFFSQKG